MMTVIIKTWSTPDNDDSDYQNLVNPRARAGLEPPVTIGTVKYFVRTG